jgi:hypothetical protein
MFIWPADFFKLRDVRLSVPHGDFLPGSSSGTISLTGRNLFRWKTARCLCIDPEMTGDNGLFSRQRYIGESVPAPASLLVSVRTVF